MKTIVLLVALLLTLLASGCAKTVLTRPGTSGYQANVDLQECKYEAAKYSSPYTQVGLDFGAGIGEVFRERRLIEGCMKSRGYN